MSTQGMIDTLLLNLQSNGGNESAYKALITLYYDFMKDITRGTEMVNLLYAHYNAGKCTTPSFTRLRFDAGAYIGQADEFYQLTHTYLGWGGIHAKLKYRFAIFDRVVPPKAVGMISYGSYDMTQAAVDPRRGGRLYHLDGYYSGKHVTYSMDQLD